MTNISKNINTIEKQKALLQHQLKSMGVILQLFPETTHFAELLNQLKVGIENFVTKTKLFKNETVNFAAEYLFYELTRSDSFVISSEAAQLHEDFKAFLKEKFYFEVLN